MDFAEQFGLTHNGACWCCGGLGLTVDDWETVEQCLFCDDTGSQPATSQPMTGAGRSIEIRGNDAENRCPG